MTTDLKALREKLRDRRHLMQGDGLAALIETTERAAQALDRPEAAEDKIDGLSADLFDAVETAYARGAKEWALLNYPKWIGRLEANAALASQGGET